MLEEASKGGTDCDEKETEGLGMVRALKKRGNIRAVAEMKMEGKRPRGRHRLRWEDTVRRNLEDQGLMDH